MKAKSMVRILTLSFCLFLVCVGGGFGADLNLARMNVTTVGGGVPVAEEGGLSWTNCVFFLTAEANDTVSPYTMHGTYDHSAGDTTGVINEEGLSITSTAPLVGTYSFSQAGWGWLAFDVSSNNILPGRVGAIGFWYRYTALPTGTDYFLYGINSGDDICLSVRVSSGGEITFHIFDGETKTWATTNASLTTNTSYFIEILYDGANGTCAIYVNNVQKTLNAGTQTFNSVSPVYLLIGDAINEGGEGKWDNVMIFSTNMRLWDFRSAAYGD